MHQWSIHQFRIFLDIAYIFPWPKNYGLYENIFRRLQFLRRVHLSILFILAFRTFSLFYILDSFHYVQDNIGDWKILKKEKKKTDIDRDIEVERKDAVRCQANCWQFNHSRKRSIIVDWHMMNEHVARAKRRLRALSKTYKTLIKSSHRLD